jgi:hypothetical protein
MHTKGTTNLLQQSDTCTPLLKLFIKAERLTVAAATRRFLQRRKKQGIAAEKVTREANGTLTLTAIKEMRQVETAALESQRLSGRSLPVTLPLKMILMKTPRLLLISGLIKMVDVVSAL